MPIALALGLAVGLGAAPTGPAPVGAQDFRTSMDAAMARMDSAMMTPGYSGDADVDFAAMMTAHHQGAIDMAQVELRFGTDPVLKRLAQGIVVEQQQEIEVMRRALADLRHRPSPPLAAPSLPQTANRSPS